MRFEVAGMVTVQIAVHYPEDGGSTFLRNFGKYLPYSKAPRPRKVIFKLGNK
jgi:hypothetical protein